MACRDCLRRNWLIGALGGCLEYRSGDLGRLSELLALEDQALIAAIGGRRRQELLGLYQHFEVSHQPGVVEALCHHDHDYPRALRDHAARPTLLHVMGGAARLRELLRSPVVAIVGTEQPTDHGREVSRELARGLTASGLTIASELREGTGRAVLEGALEAQGKVLAVAAGGVDTFQPASTQALSRMVSEKGCVLSALPCGLRARRWGQIVGAWLVGGLAHVVVLPEASESPRDLASARVAQQAGRALGAMPGRVTSPVSSGCHLLLREGAELIREAQDVLDLLYGVGAPHAQVACEPLEPWLQSVLDRVGSGEDTLGRLIPHSVGRANENECSSVMLALAELELMGLLGRGDGGRYVPSMSRPGTRGPRIRSSPTPRQRECAMHARG